MIQGCRRKGSADAPITEETSCEAWSGRRPPPPGSFKSSSFPANQELRGKPPTTSRQGGGACKRLVFPAQRRSTQADLMCVGRLPGEVERKGERDLFRDVGSRLPVIVISDMLGLPSEGRTRFTRRTDDMMAFLG